MVVVFLRHRRRSIDQPACGGEGRCRSGTVLAGGIRSGTGRGRPATSDLRLGLQTIRLVEIGLVSASGHHLVHVSGRFLSTLLRGSLGHLLLMVALRLVAL